MQQKISPFLWFNGCAEDAVNFYTSVFAEAKIGKTMRASKAGPGPEGSVLTIGFELFGRKFTAFNFPTDFKFTEAVSFVVDCKDQAEVDYFRRLFVRRRGAARLWLDQGPFWRFLADYPNPPDRVDDRF